MKFVGIDPGHKGFACIIDDDDGDVDEYADKYDYIQFFPLADFSEFRNVMQCSYLNGACVCLEQVHAMTGQGVSSIWTFAEQYGRILEVLDESLVNYIIVQPPTWKKAYGLNLGRGATKQEKKEASIQKAKELFPGIPLRRTDKCKVDDDNMAEALLLAEYVRRKYGREQDMQTPVF